MPCGRDAQAGFGVEHSEQREFPEMERREVCWDGVRGADLDFAMVDLDIVGEEG